MQADVIHCLAPGCPDPDAAHKILSDPETRDIVEFTDLDFRILHPLRERIGGSLFDCPVNRACQEIIDDPPEPGRYRAWMDEGGILTLDLLPLPEQPLPARPAYDYPLNDPRHRCVQGVCDDHAGPVPDNA